MEELQTTSASEPERLDLRSEDVSGSRRADLLRLFPEAAGEDGAVNFDQLKRAIGESVEPGKERFGLTWPGKSECFRTIQTPTRATLLPVPEKSVEFNTTSNSLIVGDNLEVLKLLQKAYLGKVKMIYIDPPYNTGNDFIYPDDFAESLQTYLAYTGQVDAEGRKFSTNPESSGRFHSNWLDMMYPRLYLARNLLREDGVIFMSIDDREVGNLKAIALEIFGEENFLGIACRVAKKTNNKGDFWAPNFDYVVTFARNSEFATPFFGGVNLKAYDQVDADGPRAGEKYQLVRLYMSNIRNRNPEQRFFVDCPDGTRVIPPGSTFPPQRPVWGDGIWRWTKTKFDHERDRIVIRPVRSSNLIDEHGQQAKWNVYTKTYLNDVIADASAKPNALLEAFLNETGSEELKKLEIPFDYPKPSGLVKHLIQISRCQPGDIVMDFFAGSGPTAQAAMEYACESDTRLSFILVQLPEPTGREDLFRTVADICRERVVRVIQNLRAKRGEQLQIDAGHECDLGFSYWELAESNFHVWDAARPDDETVLTEQLEAHIDHVRADRSELDVLYEVLLKSGFALDSHAEQLDVGGVAAWSVADGAMIVGLNGGASLEQIRAIAGKGPLRVVMIDEAFAGNDQLKANAAQIFKSKGIAFKTV